MKLLVVILDGLGDEKYEILGGKTPFNFAKTPNLDTLKSGGSYGFFNTEKAGHSVESMPCILNIIGADEKAFDVGRSLFEAKAKDISLGANESVIRINIVTTDKSGKLKSFNGQGLNEEKIREIFKIIKKKYDKTYFLSGYKGVMIFGREKLFNSPLNLSPHENLGGNYSVQIHNNIGKNKYLMDLLEDINGLLQSYNKGDIFYKAYFYSKANEVNIKSFSQIYGENVGFVGFAEVAMGIAKMMKMQTVIPDKTTGDFDTSLKNKVMSAKEILKNYNVCFVHINGLDEISHRKNVLGKIKFIEKIDDEFFGEIINYEDNLKILVISDHITSSKTGMHKNGDVPYITNLDINNGLTVDKIHETIRNFV